MSALYVFLYGAISMGFALAGVFFLRFWAKTRDALFSWFAAAFWLLALSQTLVALSGLPNEDRGWIYLLRVAAFGMIIYAVIRKNLPRNS
jgi:hypothetical protein